MSTLKLGQDLTRFIISALNSTVHSELYFSNTFPYQMVSGTNNRASAVDDLFTLTNFTLTFRLLWSGVYAQSSISP